MDRDTEDSDSLFRTAITKKCINNSPVSFLSLHNHRNMII